MLKYLLLVFFLAACQGASLLPSLPDNRIIGGETADIEEAPYTAALLYDRLGIGRYSVICSGTILTETVVVTSARCLDKTEINRWRIHIGSAFVEIGGQNLDARSMVIHESFNEQLDNDIGLIVTLSPMQIDGTQVAVAKLPTEDFVVSDGAEVSLTGYGSVEIGGPATGYLQNVTLRVVNQQQCVSLYAGVNAVTDRMICVGNLAEEQGACDGDNGGPLVQMDGTLIGIVSWSGGCGLVGQPVVGTRITSMVSWILGNLPNYSQN